jgi:hypothetical protein
VNVTLDNLTLGGLFEPDSFVDTDDVEWTLTALNGWWGSPGTKTRRSDRSIAPGAYRAAAYKGVRTIEVGGVFTAQTHSGLSTRRAARQLAALCSDPSDLYKLTVTDEVSQTCAYVELDGEVLTELRDNLSWSMRFSVQLAAPDPRKFDLGWVTHVAPVSSDGTGGIVATDPGIDTDVLGILSGTPDTLPIAQVEGKGTADNPVVLQVLGPTGAFEIVNTSGTSTIGFGGQLGTGESLYLNLDPQTVYNVPGLDIPIPGHGAVVGTTSARAAISVRGGWPVLTAGGLASYLISGSLGSGSALLAHTRGAWS